MSKHKKQHFIPRCYLNAWCDTDIPQRYVPSVWMFDANGSTSCKKAPENIFCETDMYTINRVDGSRDLRLEHGLSQLESKFAKIRVAKIDKNETLDLNEHLYLCAFTAAMQIRTRGSREHHRSQWQPLLDKMDKMAEWIKSATPEQLDSAVAAHIPSSSSENNFIGYDQAKSMVETPLQALIPTVLETVTPILYKMDLAFLVTDDDIGFITSDHPCCLV